jgi:DNA-binding CsgD family transcriptional regulator
MKGKNLAVAALTKFVVDKANYSDEAIETDSAKIVECVKFIERVLHDVVVVLCGRDRVNYVSSNCKSIIGHSHTFFQSLTLDETVELLHEDDVPGFKSCMEKVSRITSPQYDQYKFILQYRLKKQDGGIIVIRDEKIATETTPGKFVFISLLKNISTEGIFAGVKLTIQKKVKTKFITIDEFFPNTMLKTLTPRQVDIVSLVARGLSNKAIAEKLNLSLSTVKNHKQVLFRKINVRSSIEMLSSMQHVSRTNS